MNIYQQFIAQKQNEIYNEIIQNETQKSSDIQTKMMITENDYVSNSPPKQFMKKMPVLHIKNMPSLAKQQTLQRYKQSRLNLQPVAISLKKKQILDTSLQEFMDEVNMYTNQASNTRAHSNNMS